MASQWSKEVFGAPESGPGPTGQVATALIGSHKVRLFAKI